MDDPQPREAMASILIRLPKRLLEQIDRQAAAEERLSRASLIRQACSEYLRRTAGTAEAARR